MCHFSLHLLESKHFRLHCFLCLFHEGQLSIIVLQYTEQWSHTWSMYIVKEILFNMIFLLLEYFIYNLYCKYNTLANTELNEKYVVEMLYVIVLSPCRWCSHRFWKNDHAPFYRMKCGHVLSLIMTLMHQFNRIAPLWSAITTRRYLGNCWDNEE